MSPLSRAAGGAGESGERETKVREIYRDCSRRTIKHLATNNQKWYQYQKLNPLPQSHSRPMCNDTGCTAGPGAQPNEGEGPIAIPHSRVSRMSRVRGAEYHYTGLHRARTHTVAPSTQRGG